MKIQTIFNRENQKIIDKKCDEMIQIDKMKQKKVQDSLKVNIKKENEGTSDKENNNGSNQRKKEISNGCLQKDQQNLNERSDYDNPVICDNCDSEFIDVLQQNNEELYKCKSFQTDNSQKKEEFSNMDFLTSKIEELKNKKLISTDFTIEVVAALEELLKNKSQDEIKKCIKLIQQKKNLHYNSKQQKIDSKIKRKFDVFLRKKYYDLENFKTKTFETNIFNIIAVRLVKEDKKKCTQKLQECYSQLSKNWINLLDFKDGKYKEYFSILQQVKELLKNQGISLGTDLKEYFLHKNYAKYNFLEITEKLLQILTIYYDEKIFKLLYGIVQMKLDKYKSKRAINFNKKNIINLIYDDNGEIDYNVKQEIKEIIEESDNYQNQKLQN